MIGKNICKIRKEKGLSLSEVAGRARISKSYLSNIERGLNQNPSVNVMGKIAQVLNVDMKVLLNTEESSDSPAKNESEWNDFVNELKDSGIEKEQIKEYRTLIEFIKWQNRLDKSI